MVLIYCGNVRDDGDGEGDYGVDRYIDILGMVKMAVILVEMGV